MEASNHTFSPEVPISERPLSKEGIRLAASEKAQEMFALHAIREESFIGDVYDETMVQGHLAEVAKLDAIFEQRKQEAHENAPGHSGVEVKQYGDILEAVIFDAIRQYGWFGEGVSPRKTSKFDDYKNGIDLIVDLEHSRRPLALAIDVTFGFQGMKKKVGSILDKIDAGKMGFVRYYRSEDNSYEGKLNNLAKVVVGVDMDTVQKLAEYWIQENDEALRTHYAQTLILSEIALQLRAYARYAEQKSTQAREQGNSDMEKKYSHIAMVYHSDLEKISDILDQKPNDDMDNSDRVYDCLFRVVREEIQARV